MYKYIVFQAPITVYFMLFYQLQRMFSLCFQLYILLRYHIFEALSSMWKNHKFKKAFTTLHFYFWLQVHCLKNFLNYTDYGDMGSKQLVKVKQVLFTCP